MKHESVLSPEATRMGVPVTEAEMAERNALGLPKRTRAGRGIIASERRRGVKKRAVHSDDILNEAYAYEPRASSFSRGLRIDLGCGTTHILLSGTASIGTEGETLHPGDFRAQCWRTYRNLTRLLESEEASWHDVVRTTCFLRDIERDYDAFNEIRTEFFDALDLDPLPASTGIQVRLCRSDLLVEMEAHAILERGK